jgi:hypothetical protein
VDASALIGLVHALAPQSAGLLACAGVVVWLGRLIRAEIRSDRDRTTKATLGRFGSRIGALEQGRPRDRSRVRHLELRLYRIETALRTEGVNLPWSDPIPPDEDDDDPPGTEQLPAGYAREDAPR